MKKVLVADDKASSRELIRIVLEQSGYSVCEAGDGPDALRIAPDFLPDLHILDLHMPALDGFGPVQKLRLNERFRTTPIMAITASAMQGDRERALAAGFTSYIAKPMSLRRLRSEVDRLLGKECTSAASCC